MSVDRGKGGGRGLCHQFWLIRTLISQNWDLVVELRTGLRGAVLTLLSRALYRVGRFDGNNSIRNLIFTHIVKPAGEEYQHSIDHNLNILAPLDPLPTDLIPRLSIPGRVEYSVLHKLETYGLTKKSFIVLHPFSIWHYKELSSLHYVRLIHYFSEIGCPLVITGSKDEQKKVQHLVQISEKKVVNMAGETSIIEMAGILRQAMLVVSIDTSAIHLSAAVGTPTVSIFGPSSPVHWAPRGDKHLVITNTMACIPCKSKGCQNSEESRCLLDLDPKVTISSIDNHIKKLHLMERHYRSE